MATRSSQAEIKSALELVDKAIQRHIDSDAWVKEQAFEASERGILERMTAA